MDSGGIAGDQLRSLVERYERLQEEIDALNADRSQLMKEVAGAGFAKTIFKIVIKRRHMSTDQLDEEVTMVELYEQAINETSRPSRARAHASEAPEHADAVI